MKLRENIEIREDYDENYRKVRELLIANYRKLGKISMNYLNVEGF